MHYHFLWEVATSHRVISLYSLKIKIMLLKNYKLFVIVSLFFKICKIDMYLYK